MKALLVLFLMVGGNWTGSAAHKPTILAVFAHPDDETSVGGLLARYAAEGHDVYLAIATSGQMGDGNTKLDRGSALGSAREEEARCACRELGIHPPMLLQFMDGSLAGRNELGRLVTRIREVFEEVKPDVVITWGPDGLSGHPDHRIISSVTTEVFQHQQKLSFKPTRLFYVAFPEDRFHNAPPEAAAFAASLISPGWISHGVDITGYSDHAFRAIQCHKTQWPPPTMGLLHRLITDVLGNRVFLRKALDREAQNPARQERIEQ